MSLDPAHLTAPPPQVNWRVWPLADGERRAWLWMAIVVALTVIIARTMEDLAWGALVLVVLLISLRRLFFPVSYRLSSEGVEQRLWRRRRKISWRRIQRYHIYPDGIFFALSSEFVPWDVFRGVYLPLGRRCTLAVRRDALATVRYHLSRDDR